MTCERNEREHMPIRNYRCTVYPRIMVRSRERLQYLFSLLIAALLLFSFALHFLYINSHLVRQD